MKISIILLIFFHFFYFFPFYFTENIIFQRDLPFLTLPEKFEAIWQWRKGIIPFWDEKFSNGQPLLANPTSSSLYPLMLPMIIFPNLKTFTYLCLFHHLLFIFGVFLFSNLFLKNPYLSLIISNFLGYNGFTIEFFSFCNPLWGIMYLPWALISFYFFLKKKKNIYLILTSILFSLSIYAGFDIAVFVFSFSLLILTFFINYKKIPELFICFFLTFLIASPQIIPTLKYLPHTSRGAKEQIYENTSGFFSLHPLRIFDLFIPKFHGFPTAKNKETFWADVISDREGGLFISPYFGMFIILFLLSLRPLRYRWLFFSGTLLFLLLSFGRYFPLHFYFQKIPILSNIRFPEKFLIFLLIFFSTFLIINLRKYEKISPVPSLILVIFLSSILLINFLSSNLFFKKYISRITFQEINAQPGIMQKNLIISLFLSILILFSFIFFKKNEKILFFLPILCFFDLWYGCSHRIVPYTPEKLNSPLTRLLKEQKPLRILHYEEGVEYNPGSKNIVTFRIQTLYPNYGTFFGFSYAFSRSVDAMEPSYLNRKIENIDYKLWGISHMILSGMKAPKEGDFKRFSGYDLWWIERNPAFIWFFDEEKKEAKPIPAPLNIENPSKIQISIKNKKNGVLWIGYSNLPGWKVYLNGKETKMANPESEGLNVYLKAGVNKVEFKYRAPGFLEGVILMGTGIFLCVIILLWKKRN